MLPRMRTIKEAVAEFKAADPQTAVNECCLRRLVVSGKVPCVKSGTKYLLNMDKLEEFLFSESNENGTAAPEYGKIRRVE